MQALLPVLAVLGPIVAVFGLTMIVPIGVGAWYHDAGLWSFPGPMALAVVLGLAVRLVARRHGRELQPRDGILLVVLTWLVLPFFASLPLLQHLKMRDGSGLSFTDAYFEAVSALTTTGSTVITGLDALPPSINVWRTFLQWQGGIGILILVVAILPMLGVGGSQLFKAEAAGPLKDNKLTPRITQTAKGLWGVYATLSLACVLAYWAAGMSPLDAWMHMFATVSLGGLSSHDASLGYFDSPLIEVVAIVFMLISSCNFALYFVAARTGSLRALATDTETRATLGVLILSPLVAALVLWLHGTYDDPVLTLRYAFFNVVSVATTTGFITTDYLQWPVVLPVLMLMLSGVATSAGSTGCGIKMIRLLILLKQAKRELTRLVHPRAVQPLTLGGRIVDNGVILAVLGFMLVYGGVVIGLSLLLLLDGTDVVTAVSAVMASVHCMGPGLGAVGPAANFEPLSDYQTWVLTLAMLLGRLEMLVILVLFTPQFWRK